MFVIEDTVALLELEESQLLAMAYSPNYPEIIHKRKVYFMRHICIHKTSQRPLVKYMFYRNWRTSVYMTPHIPLPLIIEFKFQLP